MNGVLVIFASTRCPFMRHIGRGVVDYAREYAEKGIATIAINVNAGETFEDMAAESAKYDYPFPYVKDADQKVAAAYMASCTPDFFLFGPTGSSSITASSTTARPRAHCRSRARICARRPKPCSPASLRQRTRNACWCLRRLERRPRDRRPAQPSEGRLTSRFRNDGFPSPRVSPS